MRLKVLAMLALAAVFSYAGPVNYYGKLTAKDGSLYGAKTGTTKVQLKGMSLFWDTWDVGYNFYKHSVVDSLVSNWKIEVIRMAHGTGDNQNGNWQTYDDAVIQAAIDNNIYVIIDYHSHTANDEVSEATSFFTYMANKWGGYPNVIFEVFNEPGTAGMWSTVKSYANTIIPIIRNYSSNLIIVGNSEYSAHPEEAISNEVTDSKDNVAYTFHFYAGSHPLDDGDYNGYVTFRNRIRNAIQAGLTVFVTEWGTTNANGDGNVNTSNSDTWLAFLDTYKISWCNWSVSNKSEASAAFSAQSAYTNPANWSYSGYSTSGQYVYTKLQTHATSAAWRTASSSSSTASSSSVTSSSSTASTTTDYIDDFEDGNKYAYTGGVWYAYTDKADSGSSKITNTLDNENSYVVVQTAGTGNSTSYMAGMNGITLSQGKNKYDPYVALGINLKEDKTDYDLSKCSTISYKYKGAAHNFKAQVSTITNYNYHTTTFVAKSSWYTATINWADLSQADWGDTDTHIDITANKKKINKFAWEVKEVAGTQPAYNYLWIDDVKCDGIAITPVVISSSSSTAKSSSSIASSSSVVVSSSSVSSSSSSIAISSSSAKSSSSSAVLSSSSTISSSSAAVSSSSVSSSSSSLAISSSSAKSSSSSAVLSSSSTISSSSTAVSSSSMSSSSSSLAISSSSTLIASSSSEVIVSSSSSTPIDLSGEWTSTNTNLSDNTSTGVTFGQSNDYNSDRIITKTLTSLTAGTTYIVTFSVLLNQSGSITLATTVDGLCNESTALTTTDQTVTCTFTATSSTAILTLTVPGGNWQTVYVTHLTVTPEGTTVLADKTQVHTLNLVQTHRGIAFTLTNATRVQVQVFDMLGHVVDRSTMNLGVGIQEATFEKLNQGNYIVRVKAGSSSESVRLQVR